MNLNGKLLIAMPGMGDPRFEHSVVFLCAHSEDGAMGLIVNKPAGGLTFDRLAEQLGIQRSDRSRAIRVHFGGPVEHSRGFVLHSGDYAGTGTTLKVDDRFGMTATLDILEAIAAGRGPSASLLALGYAGWGPGQLEDEILRNGWLTCEAAPDLVFSSRDGEKWTRALKTIGVDPLTLSSAAGRA
jgi:putative transcriptional regulator